MAATRKPRASWIDAKERVLLETLENAVLDGEGGDNGFKPQTWTCVVRAVNACHPVSEYTEASVKNKVQELRNEFARYKRLSEHTGFGLENGILTAGDQTWENVISHEPKCAKFRHSPLQHKEKLYAIFEGRVPTSVEAQPYLW